MLPEERDRRPITNVNITAAVCLLSKPYVTTPTYQVIAASGKEVVQG
jgi:hypothetical protein